MREFWLCDLDPAGVELLEEIKDEQTLPKRRIEVLSGDFNIRIHDILGAGTIKPTTATFALLDQRTFECDWATVQALARHKQTHKIEMFYFLATGWLDRSIAAVSRPETAERLTNWWGRDDWRDLRKASSAVRGVELAERFKTELGYTYAYPYPIHSERRGGRIMYHMIHATDHPAAPPLMQRAYRKIAGRSLDDKTAQQDLETLLAKYMDQDALDAVFRADDPTDRVSINIATDRPDASSAEQGAPLFDLDEIVTRLEAGASTNLAQKDEREMRRALRNAALQLAEALDDRRPTHGEMGHNGPPLDDEGNPFPADFVSEIQNATRLIVEETGKLEPDALKVAQASSRLQALKAWLKPRVDLATDEFAKALGSSAGVATIAGVGITCAGLAQPLHDTVVAAFRWLTTILLLGM
jgi:three-Cys-motif partner protein